jgi:hypothetical protein
MSENDAIIGTCCTLGVGRVRLEAIPGANSVVEVLPIPYTALAQALPSAMAPEQKPATEPKK